MDDFPEFETYADVIDAYERDNMGYATLTDYIKGENIKIKEIDISPLSDLKNMRDGGRIGFDLGGFERVKKLAKDLFGKEVKDLNDDELESIREYLSESKADGGSVGIEVLFTEKMKDGGRAGFFMGGSPLEGQALSIYNSMNAYGFSDQEIANALQERGLYTPPGSDSGTTTPDTNIIGAQLNQDRGGGGGITELQKTYTRETAPPQKFTGDPTAQLTGKGRLDPMGSGFDEILKSVTASNTNRVLTDDQLKQKAFFQDVYQEPQELSFLIKLKKHLEVLKINSFNQE